MRSLLKSSVVPVAATLTLLVLLAALSGCGQKGPLVQAAPAASAAAR